MLDEDGVTGQVAMDDGGITGVEVAGDAEQRWVKALNPTLHPFPCQATSEEKMACARDLQ